MRQDYQSLIREIVVFMGMDPTALTIGLIGGIVSIFYRINGMNWKMSSSVLVSGGCLAGYIMPVIKENLSLGDGTTSFAVFIIGVLSPDFFRWLVKLAPEILKGAGDKIKKKYFKDGSGNDDSSK